MAIKRKIALILRMNEQEKKLLDDYAKQNNMSLNMALVTLIKSLKKEDKQNDWRDLEIYWKLWGSLRS